MMRRYVAPYQRYLVFSLFFNVLSAVLNIFSFLSIVPMLNLLFGTDQAHYSFIAWDAAGKSMKDILINNLYFYTAQLIEQYGASTTLLLIGLFLVLTTGLKTGSYFA